MKITHKLLLLIAIPALAIAIIAMPQLLKDYHIRNEMHQVHNLVEINHEIAELVHHLQHEREIVAAYLGSHGHHHDEDLEPSFAKSNKSMDVLLRHIEELHLADLNKAYAKDIEYINKDIDELRTQRNQIKALKVEPLEALATYEHLNKDLIHLIVLSTHVSHEASINAELIALANFLKSKEALDMESAILEIAFQEKKISESLFEKLLAMEAVQKATEEEFLNMAAPKEKLSYEELMVGSKAKEYKQVTRQVKDKVHAKQPLDYDPERWLQTSSALLDELAAIELEIVHHIDEMVNEASHAALMDFVKITLLSLSAIVVTLVLGFFFSRSINRPIKVLIEKISLIAHGDLTHQIDASRRDELGQIARAQSELIERFREVLMDAQMIASSVSSASTELSATAEQVSSATMQNAEAIHQIANQSVSVAESAEKARDTASEGSQVVDDNKLAMQHIREAVLNCSNEISALGDKSDRISEVIKIIDEIADQTNLLALNAAIEAARAGEAGRGFAVVADEVRALAERTVQATSEVATSIREVQEGTIQAIQSMQGVTEKVGEGVLLADQSGESLNVIHTRVNDVSALIQNIAAAAEEQSATGEEIKCSMEQISGGVHGIGAAMQLSNDAEKLNEMLSHFKVK